MESPDPYIEFLENWIPGIGEPTVLHDLLHEHFHLGFSIEDEARLLGSNWVTTQQVMYSM